MVYQGAAFPTREVILQRLQQTCDRAAADDTVWFFFSGYGMHWQGQDYLLPIDGDPAHVDQTAVSLRAIVELLQYCPARQRLLILDMSRSQSALPHQRLGVATMELAKQLEIPLILSCRPNQFSQETLAVRHGLFTAALLEGLRFHGCLTLSQLAAYLNDRLPELCYHHFRPEQNIVSVIPTQYQFLMLVPPQSVNHLPPSEASVGVDAQEDSYKVSPSVVSGWADRGPKQVGLPPDVLPASAEITPGDPVPLQRPIEPPSPAPEVAAAFDAEPAQDDQGEADRAIGWQRWLLVGAGMLLLGVLLRNQAAFLGNRQPDREEIQAPETIDAAPAATSEMAADDRPEPPLAPAEQPIAEPLFPEVGGAGAFDPQVALDQARIALDQKRFGEALNWLDQVPEAQQPEDFVDLQNQARTGYDNASRSGQEVLDSARQIIEPLSASRFNDAIEEARQVPV